MIVFTRTGDIAPGKIGDMMAFAPEIAALFTKITGVKLTMMTPIGGNPNQMVWQATYDNLGAMEAAMEKVLSNPEYTAKVASAADLFMPGSIRDAMWKTLG